MDLPFISILCGLIEHGVCKPVGKILLFHIMVWKIMGIEITCPMS